MLPLYSEHFGLSSQPFSVSPDPRFFYGSPSHKEGLAELYYGIRARRGFVVLTGEVGTGKTTLIRSLLEKIDDGRTRVAFIFTLISNVRELLRAICEALGLSSAEDGSRETQDYLALFNAFLLAAYRNGDNVTVVIDEAQNLSPDVLEGVRLLSNCETAETKLLQILLVGQPELDRHLNEPEMRQLKQRVALRFHLSPLSPAECREYIAKRLEIAGGSPSLIPESTSHAVYAFSGGIPRLINMLCDNGLLAAFMLGRTHVEVSMIEEIARSLHIGVEPRRRAVLAAVAKPVKFTRRSAVARQVVETKTAAVAKAAVSEPEFERTSIAPSVADIQSMLKTFETKGDGNGSPNGAAPGSIAGSSRALRRRGAEREAATVPSRSFERMIAELTEAMGPMAPLVVSDHVKAMDEFQERFPRRRFGQLIDLTSDEILSGALKTRYQSIMTEEIRAIGAIPEEP